MAIILCELKLMKTYTTDGSGRICLGKEFANKIFILNAKKGTIELIPVQIVPEKSLTVVKQGPGHAKAGKEKLSSSKKKLRKQTKRVS